MPIYVPRMNVANEQLAGGDAEVVLALPGVPGAEVVIAPHSTIRNDGTRGPVWMYTCPVDNRSVPMPPPGGSAPLIAATLQPSGTRLDPPAAIRWPNLQGLPPGAQSRILSFDHDLGEFVSHGTATVSEDGLRLVSDPGAGLRKAGWHFPEGTPIPQADVEGQLPKLLLRIDTAPRPLQAVPHDEPVGAEVSFTFTAVLQNASAADTQQVVWACTAGTFTGGGKSGNGGSIVWHMDPNYASSEVDDLVISATLGDQRAEHKITVFGVQGQTIISAAGIEASSVNPVPAPKLKGANLESYRAMAERLTKEPEKHWKITTSQLDKHGKTIPVEVARDAFLDGVVSVTAVKTGVVFKVKTKATVKAGDYLLALVTSAQVVNEVNSERILITDWGFAALPSTLPVLKPGNAIPPTWPSTAFAIRARGLTEGDRPALSVFRNGKAVDDQVARVAMAGFQRSDVSSDDAPSITVDSTVFKYQVVFFESGSYELRTTQPSASSIDHGGKLILVLSAEWAKDTARTGLHPYGAILFNAKAPSELDMWLLPVADNADLAVQAQAPLQPNRSGDDRWLLNQIPQLNAGQKQQVFLVGKQHPAEIAPVAGITFSATVPTGEKTGIAMLVKPTTEGNVGNGEVRASFYVPITLQRHLFTGAADDPQGFKANYALRSSKSWMPLVSLGIAKGAVAPFVLVCPKLDIMAPTGDPDKQANVGNEVVFDAPGSPGVCNLRLTASALPEIAQNLRSTIHELCAWEAPTVGRVAPTYPAPGAGRGADLGVVYQGMPLSFSDYGRKRIVMRLLDSDQKPTGWQWFRDVEFFWQKEGVAMAGLEALPGAGLTPESPNYFYYGLQLARGAQVLEQQIPNFTIRQRLPSEPVWEAFYSYDAKKITFNALVPIDMSRWIKDVAHEYAHYKNDVDGLRPRTGFTETWMDQQDNTGSNLVNAQIRWDHGGPTDLTFAERYAKALVVNKRLTPEDLILLPALAEPKNILDEKDLEMRAQNGEQGLSEAEMFNVVYVTLLEDDAWESGANGQGACLVREAAAKAADLFTLDWSVKGPSWDHK